MKRRVAQLGRALRSGRRGRRFKSCRADLPPFLRGFFIFTERKRRLAFADLLMLFTPAVKPAHFNAAGSLSVSYLFPVRSATAQCFEKCFASRNPIGLSKYNINTKTAIFFEKVTELCTWG